MHITLLAWILLAAIACGDDSNASPDASGAGDSPEPAAECPAETPTFAAEATHGLEASDPKTGLSVRIIDANYSPPAKNFNDWEIAVTDQNGAPMPQAHVTWACAWMAVHGHGSNPRSVENADDGRFWLRKQNLSMYGGWQVRLWITTDAGARDYVFPKGSSLVNSAACQAPDSTMGSPNISFDICVPTER
jgi:hypothetical protein